MSKTQLQTNNTRLASLIDTLKGKAAGGGSGGSPETCELAFDGGYLCESVCTTIDESGDTIVLLKSTGVYYGPVVCGSIFAVGYSTNITITDIVVDGLELLCEMTNYAFFKVTANAGEQASLSISIEMD